MLILSLIVMGLIFTSFMNLSLVFYGLTLISIFSLFMIEGVWNFNVCFFYLSTDVIGWGFIILSVWVTCLMYLSSIKGDGIFNVNFVLMILLLLVFLVFSFSVGDLMGYYVFFESSLIPILLMVMGWGYQPERLKAGYYLLFYTLFGSLPLLLVILWFGGGSGGTWFGSVVDYVNLYVYVGFVGAFLLSMPIFMFHLWLPKAHVEAPVAGSMILAGVLLKLGGYGLMRVFSFVGAAGGWGGYVMSLGLLGGSITGLMCLGQVDMKSLVAYSSIGHMGVGVAGLFSYYGLGLGGGFVMMISHGFTSSGLFCVVNMFYEKVLSRSMVFVKGLLVIFPSVGLWWFLLCASNMSCPPTINLLGEIMLFWSVLGWASASLVFMGILTFVCASYSLYLYAYSAHGLSVAKFYLGNVSVKEYVLCFCHWMPLNFLILSVDILGLY